jgi:hypothetical protein
MAKPPSGYQIAAAMSQAKTFVETLSADITSDHQALMMALDTETPVLDLLCAVVRASKEAERSGDGCDERIAELSERKARYKVRYDRLRALALSMMTALDLDGWEFPEFTVAITRGRPRYLVTDIDALPPELVRVTRAPNMAEINKAAKLGPVPGTETTNCAPSLMVHAK